MKPGTAAHLRKRLAYMPDQLPPLFISYSHADSAFVDRLEADLRSQGWKPWVDRHGLVGGLRWRRELQEFNGSTSAKVMSRAWLPCSKPSRCIWTRLLQLLQTTLPAHQ